MSYKRLASRVLNRTGLVDAYGYARRYLTGSQVAIIAYHRVGFKDHRWSHSCVEPPAFEKHLAYMTKNFRVLSILELANIISEGRPLPERAVVITFDDGYRDVYLYAYPLLKKYNATASIFISSHYIGNDELFWWDKLSYYLEFCKLDRIELPGLGVIDLGSKVLRHQACVSLNKKLKGVDEFEKQGLINCLARQTRVEEPHGAARKLILDWQEIAIMANDGLDIGSHTINHAILTSLSPPEVEAEIVESKQEIEDRIQRPVLSFAYPNGNYESGFKTYLMKHGYKCAAIVANRLLRNGENPYELPRISGLEDINQFKMNLMGCLPWSLFKM